jgi:hypothetical protein
MKPCPKCAERSGPGEIVPSLNSAGYCHKCGHDDEKLAEAAHVEKVNHPAHYGGADNPYEAIKVIEAWSLGFNLGNTIKYISRAGKKGDRLEDLKKARWYLDRAISRLSTEALPGDYPL